jgi:hypothetical protein
MVGEDISQLIRQCPVVAAGDDDREDEDDTKQISCHDSGVYDR